MNETKQLSAEQEQAGVIVRLREEIASLKTEAERDKSAARLAFDTLAEERDHLRAERDQLRREFEIRGEILCACIDERERHIEAAAHKELDWFAEKRRADLLEAKCAELWQLLETVKYRIDLPAPNISGSNGLRKLLETLPNNPGQLLLDRLAKAEAKCAEMVPYLQHRSSCTCEGVKIWEPIGTEQPCDCGLRELEHDNPGQPLLDELKRLKEDNEKLERALRHEINRNHEHRADICDGCRESTETLAAREPKERG